MTKTILTLSLLLCLSLNRILPTPDSLIDQNQPSLIRNIRNTQQVFTQRQTVISRRIPIDDREQPGILPIFDDVIPMPIKTPIRSPGVSAIGTKKNINFKPFPQLQPGQALLSAVTPKYNLKDGIITAVPLDSIRDIKATAVNRQHAELQVREVAASQDNLLRRGSVGQATVAKVSVTPNKDQVRNHIWSWMASPLGNGLQNSNTLDNQAVMTDNKQLKCFLKVFNYSNPSEDLMNSDQSMDVLYPGSLIQGKKIDSGAQILQKLPISTVYRHPIRIGGNGNFVPRWANSSEAADVHRTIKQAIWNSEGFYSSDVFLKLATSSELSSLLVTLNFNAKIMKVLDISGGFTGNWTTKKNKFFITMLQGIADFYPDKMVLDGSLINDAVGVFFKQNFSLQQAEDIQNVGYWGSGNIPCFINQVTYGRLMIISVEENQRTRSLYSQLQASFKSVASINMTTTMTQMFQDSSTKLFSVGPFSQVEVADLKAGNWTNFFTEIPANSSTIQSIKPIGFRIQDFKGQNVKVSNRLQYEQVECQTKPTKNIKIQLADVYAEATLGIKRSGEANFADYGSVGGGTSPIWDITTSLTSGDNDELRVSSQGSRPNIFYRWQRKVRLIIWVDNNVVYDQIAQCKGCHSQNDAFRCRIDKYSGSVSCNKK